MGLQYIESKAVKSLCLIQAIQNGFYLYGKDSVVSRMLYGYSGSQGCLPTCPDLRISVPYLYNLLIVGRSAEKLTKCSDDHGFLRQLGLVNSQRKSPP